MTLTIAGRPGSNVPIKNRRSSRTIKGMIERFIKRNITPHKLQKLYNGLTPNQQLEMVMLLIPYAIPKASPENISSEELDKLNAMVQEALKAKHGEAI